MTDADLLVCPAFRSLTRSQRREVLGQAERHAFPAGEVILREGRTTRSLWFLLEGTCEVVKALPNDGGPGENGDGDAPGGEKRLAELEPGATFGEMSFFSPAPHSASVRAVTDCVALRLTEEAWDELVQIGLRPAFQVASQTAAVMSRRLRTMDEWITRVLAETPDPADRARRTDEWNEFRSKLFGG